eukprot:g4431.t1
MTRRVQGTNYHHESRITSRPAIMTAAPATRPSTYQEARGWRNSDAVALKIDAQLPPTFWQEMEQAEWVIRMISPMTKGKYKGCLAWVRKWDPKKGLSMAVPGPDISGIQFVQKVNESLWEGEYSYGYEKQRDVGTPHLELATNSTQVSRKPRGVEETPLRNNRGAKIGPTGYGESKRHYMDPHKRGGDEVRRKSSHHRSLRTRGGSSMTTWLTDKGEVEVFCGMQFERIADTVVNGNNAILRMLYMRRDRFRQ